MADFFAEHNSRTAKIYDDFLDEIVEVCIIQTSFKEHVWQPFFNGASRMVPGGNILAGVEVVLLSL